MKYCVKLSTKTKIEGLCSVTYHDCAGAREAYDLTQKFWADFGVDAIDSIDVLETQEFTSAEFYEEMKRRGLL